MKTTDETETVSYQEMVKNILPGMMNVGIPLNEGKIYLALILAPGISASRLCEITGIPDSKIYGAIENAGKLNMIEVQYGVPKTYRASPPSALMTEVKSLLKDRFENEITISESVEDQLQEIWIRINENLSTDNGIEIAYVVKGAINIQSKMKEMISSSKHQIMTIMPDFARFLTIREQLLEARLRGVDIKLALPQEALKKLSDDSQKNFKLFALFPQCNGTWLLLADGRLLTVSSRGADTEISAILTRARVLVQMSIAYFENPSCCFTF